MKHISKFENYNMDESILDKFKKTISKVKRALSPDLSDIELNWCRDFITTKELEEFVVAMPTGKGSSELLIISRKPDTVDSLKYYTLNRDTKEVIETDSDF